MKQRKEFGSWSSSLASESIAAGQRRLSQPQVDGEWVTWLESRPAEGGRQAVMRSRPGGSCEEISPVDRNVRTRVHEYGGGDYRIASGELFSVSFEDQRLYRGDRPLSPAGAGYADMACSPDGRWLAAVQEEPRETGEPENRLVVFDLQRPQTEPRVFASGHDFYSSPRFSPDASTLAFIAWDHPDMPWDATILYEIGWGANGATGSPRPIAGGPGESVVQPLYSPTGELFFVSDRTGWWNLYRRASAGVRVVCPREAEFGQPHWVFGMANYAFLDGRRILCSYRERDGDRLAVLDVEVGSLDEIPLDLRDIGGLCAQGDRAAFVAAGPSTPLGVYAFDVSSRRVECLRSSLDMDWDDRWGSRPEAVEFTTAEGLTAYGFFYPPQNPTVDGERGTAPPLLVKSHGGPTAQATSGLDLRIQYWTSRGFAVVDVNYGGSTGYGRAYRERLAGRWGIVDVEDCIAAARSLVGEGRVDGEKLSITGGSAGGYTTLCALTFHDVFRAGASHYGIGDLEALVRDTHKFEARYLDKLVGPYPEAQQVYRDRSPIHFSERLNCPVIFFQGLEDRVVPPSQAEQMVEALGRHGISHAYVPFEGEQHGFRQARNIATALDGELFFYSRVFGFDVERKPPAVQIRSASA